MSSLSYAAEKLYLVVSSLVTSEDRKKTLENSLVPLSALINLPLSESCVESVLNVLQSVGLEHQDYPVPIPSPASLGELPASRIGQIAKHAVVAFGDVSEALGAEGATRKALPVADPAQYRWLRYCHLAWEDHEKSADYLGFLQKALPAYPPEVLQQWFVRHGGSGISLHAKHLDLERLHFEREEWHLERLHATSCADMSWKDVGPNSHGGSWLTEITEKAGKNWLASAMAAAGTWPVPPIVFADGGLLAGARNAVAGQAYLLEGHRRTAFLMNLADRGQAKLVHAVWAAQY